MTKVIIHATISLDGFMAGPHDEMGWVFANSGAPDTLVTSVLDTTGAIVLGRRTYDIALQNNQLPYGGTVKVPQFVLTPDPREAATHDGITFNFVTDGIESAIRQAKATAGDKNVSLLGASIDQQALKSELADEILVHIVPILLGQGIRLFDQLEANEIKLERLEAVTSSQITSLRFKVVY